MCNFLGIDYSITSPGLCFYSGDPKKFSFNKCEIYYFGETSCKIKENITRLEYPKWELQTERYYNLTKIIVDNVIKNRPIEFVLIEGYSYGSRLGQIFQIAENTSLLKNMFWSRKIPFDAVSPKTVKVFATKNGNSKKEDMYSAWTEINKGVDLINLITPGTKSKKIKSPVADIIDAYWICSYLVNNYEKFDKSNPKPFVDQVKQKKEKKTKKCQ